MHFQIIVSATRNDDAITKQQLYFSIISNSARLSGMLEDRDLRDLGSLELNEVQWSTKASTLHFL